MKKEEEEDILIVDHWPIQGRRLLSQKLVYGAFTSGAKLENFR